jgi:hypothetical protein
LIVPFFAPKFDENILKIVSANVSPSDQDQPMVSVAIPPDSENAVGEVWLMRRHLAKARRRSAATAAIGMAKLEIFSPVLSFFDCVSRSVSNILSGEAVPISDRSTVQLAIDFCRPLDGGLIFSLCRRLLAGL